MRYQTSTSMTPQEVIAHAKKFFRVSSSDWVVIKEEGTSITLRPFHAHTSYYVTFVATDEGDDLPLKEGDTTFVTADAHLASNHSAFLFLKEVGLTGVWRI